MSACAHPPSHPHARMRAPRAPMSVPESSARNRRGRWDAVKPCTCRLASTGYNQTELYLPGPDTNPTPAFRVARPESRVCACVSVDSCSACCCELVTSETGVCAVWSDVTVPRTCDHPAAVFPEPECERGRVAAGRGGAVWTTCVETGAPRTGRQFCARPERGDPRPRARVAAGGGRDVRRARGALHDTGRRARRAANKILVCDRRGARRGADRRSK